MCTWEFSSDFNRIRTRPEIFQVHIWDHCLNCPARAGIISSIHVYTVLHRHFLYGTYYPGFSLHAPDSSDHSIASYVQKCTWLVLHRVMWASPSVPSLFPCTSPSFTVRNTHKKVIGVFVIRLLKEANQWLFKEPNILFPAFRQLMALIYIWYIA